MSPYGTISRRRFLRSSLIVCGCAACGGVGAALSTRAWADASTRVKGAGYELWFIGTQRETLANGKIAAKLDLRALAGQPDVYGLGPIEQLRGEVTIINSHSTVATVAVDGKAQVEESFEIGVPFFVWSRVPAWLPVAIPLKVRSFEDLEGFVPKAAARAGLDPDKPFPFLVSGREKLIEFHILNRTSDGPHHLEMLKEIRVTFTNKQKDAIIIGFHSTKHRGIFTPTDSNIHLHFQTPDDSTSGHVTKLRLGFETTLSLPAAAV
jgi:acetolactate decarboxylase